MVSVLARRGALAVAGVSRRGARVAGVGWRGTCAVAGVSRTGTTQYFQSLQRQSEVSPTLAWHERVNLVDDDRVHRREPFARP